MHYDCLIGASERVRRGGDASRGNPCLFFTVNSTLILCLLLTASGAVARVVYSHAVFFFTHHFFVLFFAVLLIHGVHLYNPNYWKVGCGWLSVSLVCAYTDTRCILLIA